MAVDFSDVNIENGKLAIDDTHKKRSQSTRRFVKLTRYLGPA